jgi:hypothetical protein
MAVDDDNESPTMGSYVLRLRLGGTEPPTGTISAHGAPVAQPFYGWIELIGAINTLRGWENPHPGQDLPPDAPVPYPGTQHHHDPDSAGNP